MQHKNNFITPSIRVDDSIHNISPFIPDNDTHPIDPKYSEDYYRIMYDDENFGKFMYAALHAIVYSAVRRDSATDKIGKSATYYFTNRDALSEIVYNHLIIPYDDAKVIRNLWHNYAEYTKDIDIWYNTEYIENIDLWYNTEHIKDIVNSAYVYIVCECLDRLATDGRILMKCISPRYSKSDKKEYINTYHFSDGNNLSAYISVRHTGRRWISAGVAPDNLWYLDYEIHVESK